MTESNMKCNMAQDEIYFRRIKFFEKLCREEYALSIGGNVFDKPKTAVSSFGSSGGKTLLSSGMSSTKTLMKGNEITKMGSLDYAAGDRVKHIKFGVGTVVSITDSGRDYEVLVNFDTAGPKKMFASFAKLKKV